VGANIGGSIMFFLGIPVDAIMFLVALGLAGYLVLKRR
jgi:hypothetical protein